MLSHEVLPPTKVFPLSVSFVSSVLGECLSLCRPPKLCGWASVDPEFSVFSVAVLEKSHHPWNQFLWDKWHRWSQTWMFCHLWNCTTLTWKEFTYPFAFLPQCQPQQRPCWRFWCKKFLPHTPDELGSAQWHRSGVWFSGFCFLV